MTVLSSVSKYALYSKELFSFRILISFLVYLSMAYLLCWNILEATSNIGNGALSNKKNPYVESCVVENVTSEDILLYFIAPLSEMFFLRSGMSLLYLVMPEYQGKTSIVSRGNSPQKKYYIKCILSLPM